MRRLSPIRPEQGLSVITAARAIMADYRARGVRFQLQQEDSPPDTSDCSVYVAHVMRAAVLPIPLVCTWEIEDCRWYLGIAREDARGGDVIWQPGHMGIYLGESFVRRGKVGYRAYEMTRRGPRRPIGTWGPAGVHAGGGFTAFYRACAPRRRAGPGAR